MLRHSPSVHRSGATAVLIAIILPVLLLIVGFSLDLAYMQLARAELRAATDLAAKAASAELADTGSTTLAIAKGKQIASSNLVAGQALTLEDADFVFGRTTRSTTSKWSFYAGGTPTNAVQINARRTNASPDGAVGLYFSGLMGGGGYQTTSSATAGFINADICLVLDRSSSMKLAVTDPSTGLGGDNPRRCDTPWLDSRWVAVEDAVDIFLSKMNTTASEERVALVTFASNYVICDVTSQAATLDEELTNDINKVADEMIVLSSSIWNGKTEISVGMALARTELTSARARSTAHKIMIVLTDGAFTNGIHPSGEATLAAGDDIQVHTITFGAVPSSVIADMQATAAAGNGKHYHAPDAVTLNDVFTEIAGSISILTQ